MAELSGNDAAQNNTNADSNQNSGDANVTAQGNEGQENAQGTTPVVPGTPKAEGDPAANKAGTPEGTDNASKEEGAKVPDTYTDFSVPEGVNINPEILGKFTTLSKEMGLTQENAQKFVNMASSQVSEIAKQNLEAWDNVRETWVKDIKADKEFGGEKFNETVERAKRTLTRFGSDEIKNFLEATGYGDNPHLIKLLAKVDKATGEDKTVGGQPPGTGVKSNAEVFFPNQGG